MEPEIVVDLLKRLLGGADLLRERRAAGGAGPELNLALELCAGRLVEAADVIATYGRRQPDEEADHEAATE